MSIPKDTKPHAYWKQMSLIMAKTPSERFMLGMQFIEDGRKIVESSLLLKQPNLSPGELAVAVFERYYGHEYSIEKKARIKASILAWHDSSKTSTQASKKTQ